jgi:NarL family two-component system response regulator LiaR
MKEFIRVLIADDHPIVQQGLSALLTPRYSMAVVGQAQDGAEAVEKARALHPDVILMDLVMPGKSGLDAIIEIKQAQPEARILVLTSFGEEDQVSSAIKAGALGYLLKNSSPDELLHAIREVAQGNLFLPQDVALKLRQDLQQPKSEPATTSLTERELEVLKWVARGWSNKQIAAKLVISEVTARYHISNILDKLHLDNRTQLAVYATQHSLIGPDEV